MKWFCFRTSMALAAISATSLAQAPKPPTPPAASTQPAASSAAPSTSSSTPPASSSPATAEPKQPSATVPPGTAAGSTPSNPGAPTDPDRYVIGAEDSLQITVWHEQQLSGTVPVRPDGMISMVLIGDLRAAGLTPMALSADISQHLKKYIQDPVVTVTVLGVNSQRIFTVGELGHVGPIQMTPGMTVLQAIVSAGGLTQFANSKKIYILRTVGGKEQKLPFNYKLALKGDNQGITLLPGDTIVVP